MTTKKKKKKKIREDVSGSIVLLPDPFLYSESPNFEFNSIDMSAKKFGLTRPIGL
jgi:hypothetical protein